MERSVTEMGVKKVDIEILGIITVITGVLIWITGLAWMVASADISDKDPVRNIIQFEEPTPMLYEPEDGSKIIMYIYTADEDLPVGKEAVE